MLDSGLVLGAYGRAGKKLGLKAWDRFLGAVALRVLPTKAIAAIFEFMITELEAEGIVCRHLFAPVEYRNGEAIWGCMKCRAGDVRRYCTTGTGEADDESGDTDSGTGGAA